MLRALLLLLLVGAGACSPTATRPVDAGVADVERATPAASATSAQAAPTTPTASPFDAEIAAFEAADRMTMPAPGGTVFVGSSSIRLWPDVAGTFPDAQAINRGFGGSTYADAVGFAPRIVLPYQPRMVVVYAGDNDLNNGLTPEQVAADYRAFAALVRAALPQARLVVISIKPSPSRWALADAMRRANALIAQAVAADPNARFVDVFTPMLGADGLPRPELYGPDKLHMTPAGYAVWRERVAAALR